MLIDMILVGTMVAYLWVCYELISRSSRRAAARISRALKEHSNEV